MVLLLAREFDFIDWKGAQGFCRLRIYGPTVASRGLPIVVLTEPNENTGPSVTNTIEQIAAEILARYLGRQDGLDPPFVLVEHYPDRQPRGPRARWHDPFFGETFALVSFGRWSPRLRRRLGNRGHFIHLAAPGRCHVSRDQIENLIGHALEWPPCTCAVAAHAEEGR